MEWLTTDDGKYRIESLSATTFPGAIQLIRESFCQDENICKRSELNKKPIAVEELMDLCANVALDGVSLVAVSTGSGEVAAAAFNKLQVAQSDPLEKPFFKVFAEERCTQEASRAFIQFMANANERCKFFEKYGVDCSLEIMFLGTAREHRRQNLAHLLCKTSIDVARKLKDGPVSTMTVKDLGPMYSSVKPRKITTKQPKLCHAIWSAAGSKKIGKNLNFVVHATVVFNEFVQEIGPNDPTCEVAAILL